MLASTPSAMSGSRPMVTNSVVPMANPPSARAMIASTAVRVAGSRGADVVVVAGAADTSLAKTLPPATIPPGAAAAVSCEVWGSWCRWGEEDRKEAAMAEQRRRPPATSRPRATAPRRATGRSRVRRRPTRWLTPLLALTAGGLVAGSQLTPVLVDLTADSTVVDQGATAGTTSSGSVGGGLLSWSTGPVAGDSHGATVPDGDAVGGLVVPQPPRPDGITRSPWVARGESPTLTPR